MEAPKGVYPIIQIKYIFVYFIFLKFFLLFVLLT